MYMVVTPIEAVECGHCLFFVEKPGHTV